MVGRSGLPGSYLDSQLVLHNDDGPQDSPVWDWNDLFGNDLYGNNLSGGSRLGFGDDYLLPSGFQGGGTVPWLGATSPTNFSIPGIPGWAGTVPTIPGWGGTVPTDPGSNPSGSGSNPASSGSDPAGSGSSSGSSPANSGSNLLTTYNAGSADGEAGYDIRIDFKGTGWTADLQKAFEDAADYFTKVITQDIGGGATYNGVYIDDLYITAQLTSIDGVGGILGQSGPTGEWRATGLTAMGEMQFDSADAQSYLDKGLWDDIVTHEMMHVLGFGSLWNAGNNRLVPTPGEYTGKQALAAYQADGHPGAAFIPVETHGGPGTAGSHWDEAALGNELMTGYINSTNYLSDFSLMSLADLGYKVQPLAWPGNPVA